jgi:hypothetical protein
LEVGTVSQVGDSMDKSESRSKTTSFWGQRALAHIKIIIDANPGRGSATQAETAAALYVRDQLTALNIGNLRTQVFGGLRSMWLFQALVFGSAMVGHLAFGLLRLPLGTWPAWIISLFSFGFSGLLVWRKFSFQDYPLRAYLPHGPSQNVVAILPPASEVQRKVVLFAHLDSNRAVIWYATDVLLTLYILIKPIAIYGIVAAPLCYALTLLTGLNIFAWIGAGLAVFHFFAWFTGVSADLGLYSPGANSNGSGMSTLLALAERLGQQPLQHTEVWLSFTGCAVTGGDGMRLFLAENGSALKDALFIGVESVGIGERLAYLQSDGMIRKRHIPKDTERLILDLAATWQAPEGISQEQSKIQPVNGGHLGMVTEMSAVWGFNLEGVCLLALPQAGTTRLGGPFLPEYCRLTDIPDRLQVSALSMVHSFTWTLLQKLDS